MTEVSFFFGMIVLIIGGIFASRRIVKKRIDRCKDDDVQVEYAGVNDDNPFA